MWVPQPLWRRSKQLNWALTKEANLAMDPFDLKRAQLLNVRWHVALVCVRLEQVLGHLCFLALLKMAKDEVDPLWQTHGSRVGLKCHAQLQHEVSG